MKKILYIPKFYGQFTGYFQVPNFVNTNWNWASLHYLIFDGNNYSFHKVKFGMEKI